MKNARFILGYIIGIVLGGPLGSLVILHESGDGGVLTDLVRQHPIIMIGMMVLLAIVIGTTLVKGLNVDSNRFVIGLAIGTLVGLLLLVGVGVIALAMWFGLVLIVMTLGLVIDYPLYVIGTVAIIAYVMQRNEKPRTPA